MRWPIGIMRAGTENNVYAAQDNAGLAAAANGGNSDAAFPTHTGVPLCPQR